MTNVRNLRIADLRLSSPFAMVRDFAFDACGCVQLRAFHMVKFAMIFVLIVAGTKAHAQIPSGGASETIDVNRNGLGFSFRGGHAAGGTVGRDESASLFNLSPYVNIGNGLLFGDARLVYANEGGLAYSFGGGYRVYVPAWDAVLGGSIFSDRDNVTGAHFKQWGAGAEVLAHGWEVRGNVYSPYGTKSRLVRSRADASSAEFVGNNVQFDRIDTTAEALQGFDAEVGWLLPGRFAERADLRVFGGGYYYKGESVPGFSGFSTRLQTDIGGWLELGLKLTDDEVFHTNVTFTAMMHFGGFKSQEHTSRSGMQRMGEPVRRNLNLAALTSDVRIGGQIAQHANGTNLTIIHVDSAVVGPGTGTVTDPFRELSTGLSHVHPDTAEVVFTHAGSTYAAAPNNIVALGTDQSLFGEGLVSFANTDALFSHNRKVVNTVTLPGIGDLILPDSPKFAATPTLSRPELTGAAGDGVTMGLRSSLGGFVINSANGDGIVINGVSGTRIRDTLVEGATGNGIRINNAGGTTSIQDTVIRNATGVGLLVNGGSGDIGFIASSNRIDPAFGAIINSSNEALVVQNRAGGTVNMRSTTIDDTGGTGIKIRNNAGGVGGFRLIVDNANISGSTETGVSVTNNIAFAATPLIPASPAVPGDGTETYSFLNTLRTATTITNATGASVEINGIPDGSQVTFNDLDIQTPQSFGIDIDNLGGRFAFVRDLTIGVPTGTVGAPARLNPDAAISVVDSLATSSVLFGGDVTIQGVSPEVAPGTVVGAFFNRGIELEDNASGSSFTVQGTTRIIAPGDRGLSIVDNGGSVTFQDNFTIQQRVSDAGLGLNATGVFVDDSSGAISFRGDSTTIEHLPLGIINPNILISTQPAVDILDSDSAISFQQLNVNDAFSLPGAIRIVRHRVGNPATTHTPGTARIFIDDLNINENALVTPILTAGGFFANDVEQIVVNDGYIETSGAFAVDIQNAGINITLETVNSTLSPNFAIRLRETNNPPALDTFSVIGNGTPVSGGSLTNVAVGAGTLTDAAVILENAGQVSLNHMLLEDNNMGVLVTNSGVNEFDEQFLHLNNVQVFDSELHGVFATNLIEFRVAENSEFIGNGTTPTNADNGDTIRLIYNERWEPITNTLVSQFVNPYEVDIVENTFIRGFTDDLIYIENTILSQGAHIDVNIDGTEFEVVDGTDTILGDEVERAFEMHWDGIARVDLLNNTVDLQGAPGVPPPPIFGQDGFFISTTSRTDEMELRILNNEFDSLAQREARAIVLTTRGAPTQALINNNEITFGVAAEETVGMEFSLGPNVARNVLIGGNRIIFNGDGGTGMLFTRVQEQQNLGIGGNFISLADPLDIGLTERGIQFDRVIGVIDLIPSGDNLIGSPTPGGTVESFFNLTRAQVTGFISINGALGP